MRRALLLAAFLAAQSRAASPADVDAWIKSGLADYREARYHDAMMNMARVLEVSPENLTAKNYLWTIARKLKERRQEASLTPGELRSAVRLAEEKLAERKKKAEDILASLKNTYERTGNIRDPGAVLAGMEGMDRLLEGEFSDERERLEARAYFDKILVNLSEAVRKNAFVTKKDQFMAAAHLAYFQNDWAGAAGFWEKAAGEDPGDAAVRRNLDDMKALVVSKGKEAKIRDLAAQAETLQETGFHKQALETWNEILDVEPADKKAREGAARCEKVLEQKEQEAQLREMTDQGIAYFRKHQVIEAAQVWFQVLQIDPSYQQARVWLAKAGEKLKGPLPSAVKPTTPEASSKAGVVNLDEDKAMKLYREGILLYSQEDILEAVKAWEQALRFDPSLLKAKQALDQARWELEYAGEERSKK